jgi:thiosulfate/3-mercaptopyruvate sulfurtransferase
MISLLRASPLLVAAFIDLPMAAGTTLPSMRPSQPSQGKSASATATDSLLLTPAQLRDRMARGGVVLLHIGERADYNAGHIPGARFLPYDAISTPRGSGLALELPAVAKLDSVFESVGVADSSRIVLYWTKGWYSPTTRVFLTLDYVGLGDRTAILDGGYSAWTESGGAVTTDVPPPVRGSLTTRPRPGLVVDAKAVHDAIGDARTAIIDARDARFYAGEAMGMRVREGHVPSAKNLPFTTLLDDRGSFRSRDELTSMLATAGATPGKRIIAYCHIGQQATVLYFAARLLGRDATLYDGSWDDWSRRSDLPVAVGASR